MRAAGVRQVLIYCADYRGGHFHVVPDDADRGQDLDFEDAHFEIASFATAWGHQPTLLLVKIYEPWGLGAAPVDVLGSIRPPGPSNVRVRSRKLFGLKPPAAAVLALDSGHRGCRRGPATSPRTRPR
jgi:hypothetical protein